MCCTYMVHQAGLGGTTFCAGTALCKPVRAAFILVLSKRVHTVGGRGICTRGSVFERALRATW